MRLCLASTSPRRQELLRQARYAFECVPPGGEPLADGEPRSIAAVRARSKCVGAVLAAGTKPCLVLGVDTVVDVDGVELGKPGDLQQARQMLQRLAGRAHTVHTAHCLRRHPDGAIFERTTTARVAFRPFLPGELERYLRTEDWRDKAGGYGIQSHAAAFATLVAGERDTVVGLSLAALGELLRRAGA